MSALPKHRMTIAEFLDWSAGREGKHQLVRGEVFAMAPESIQHARVNLAFVNAISTAIGGAGLACEAIIDGPGVAIADDTCYIPDVTVYCGQRADGSVRLVPDPIVVVEVLSPSTESFDSSDKLVDYFSVPSFRHYVIVSLERRVISHHKRIDGPIIPTQILRDGELVLDPPGIAIPVADIFAGL
jgi:Uma2 family endonuclease